MLKEETCRSENLFTVNHTYFTKVSPSNIMPHQLEFCPARSEIPYNLSVEIRSSDSSHALRSKFVERSVRETEVGTCVDIVVSEDVELSVITDAADSNDVLKEV